MTIEIEEVVAKVQSARKYRYLCRDTIARVASWAVVRSRSPKDAAKRTKRKLHQIFGAYLPQLDFEAARRLLRQIPQGTDLERAKPVCLTIMRQHTSTRERLEILGDLYASVFRITGTPNRVIDLGCGLHPFALPWMNLPTDAEYCAWEIDERIVDLVSRFFSLLGFAGSAHCKDILVIKQEKPADVVFMLKMLPCLEQQDKGCTTRLLAAIDASFVVASFPVRSIGGSDKGMRAHYTKVMEQSLGKSGYPFAKLPYREEVFFVIDTTERHSHSAAGGS